MATHHLPYGTGSLPCDLSAALARGLRVDVLAPRAAPPAADPAGEVAAALAAAPLPPYRGGGCAIAINDHTRPVPHGLLLPALLRRLAEAGVPDSDILFVVATGTHPPTPAAQFPAIVPAEVLARCRVVSHDAGEAAGLEALGVTARGTPVVINRAYRARALRIAVGGIEPHQFVGFSGGVKTVAIGLAGYETVTRNHSMMSLPGATIGRCAGNPVREDIEEIGARVGVHLALNVILGEDGRLLRALAGPPVEVMRAGVPLVQALNQVRVAAPVDLMIVSPGGHPKDVNVYQAQKALAHAALVTRPGGTILVAAACPEGAGSPVYERWVGALAERTHEAVLAQFAREGYRVGPHKAFQIARDANRFTVRLHSEMPADLHARLLLAPAPDLQQAVDEAVAALPGGARIGVMPRANATIPVLDA